MAPTPTNRSVDRSLRASCSIQAAHRQMRWQSQSACSSVAPPNATTESPNHVHSKKNFAGESRGGDESTGGKRRDGEEGAGYRAGKSPDFHLEWHVRSNQS